MMNKGRTKAGIVILAVLCSVSIVKGVQAETYEYDELNRLKKVTYDTGKIITYEYDANGNIKNIQSSTQDTSGNDDTTTDETGGNENDDSSGKNENDDSNSGDEDDDATGGNENNQEQNGTEGIEPEQGQSGTSGATSNQNQNGLSQNPLPNNSVNQQQQDIITKKNGNCSEPFKQR